jgi:hypothetical protein
MSWFRTFINGKRVHVSIRQGLQPENDSEVYYSKWNTWNMHFAADERVKVVNKYWINNVCDGDWYGSYNEEYINYILCSGATWKGSIGKATVRMRLEGYDFLSAEFLGMSPTYIEENGTVIWTAENLEPEEDIAVDLNSDPNSHGVGNPFELGTRESDKYERMGTRLTNNFYSGYYNGATWWGNKLIRRFGDKQSMGFYYYMGVSYYKLGYSDKATSMLSQVTDKTSIYYLLSAYYKALLCKEAGDSAGFEANLKTLNGYEDWFNTLCSDGGGHYIDWIAAWAQSRLADLNAVQ